MDVNEDVHCLIERGVLEIFASKLAPTGVLRRMRELRHVLCRQLFEVVTVPVVYALHS